MQIVQMPNTIPTISCVFEKNIAARAVSYAEKIMFAGEAKRWRKNGAEQGAKLAGRSSRRKLHGQREQCVSRERSFNNPDLPFIREVMEEVEVGRERHGGEERGGGGC